MAMSDVSHSGSLPCPKTAVHIFCPHYKCVSAQKAGRCESFFVFTPIVADTLPLALYWGLHAIGVERNSFKLLMV